MLHTATSKQIDRKFTFIQTAWYTYKGKPNPKKELDLGMF